MIKFLRKIRQKLLSENKFSKYLIYAIGEIVLVVIGILIALGINNWNEENKKVAEESEYLVNLLAEFKTNHEELKTNIARHKFVKLKTKELSNLINPNPKDITSNKLDTLMWAMAYIPEFKALSSLASSEKLDLVNDYPLKNDIGNWRLTYELYNYSLKITYDQYHHYIYPFMAKNYQLKNIKSSQFPADKSDFTFNQKSILSSPIFENQVVLRSLNADVIFQRATKLFEIQENIIHLIEQKLEDEK